MAVRKTIFGSQSERELFVSINSHWSARGFVLYPSLPLASIFDITKLDITPGERSFLLKTSVDYTLCSQAGRPIVSVEFDGISHGFSRHGRYVALRRSPRNDPHRGWKLDLKVRIATIVGYPLVVMSYHEKNPIAQDLHLTILDGMIGQMLANRRFDQLLQNKVTELEHGAELPKMRPQEVQEYVQNLVTDLEVDAEMEWDPIARAAARINMELLDRRVSSSSWTHYLDPPGVPDLPDRADPTYRSALRARVAALDNAVWVGCQYGYRTIFGEVAEDVWVRNTAHAGVSPLGLAENIAMLIAGRRVLRLAEQAPAS